MKDILKEKVKYFAQIPVSILKVDHSYQKPLSMAQVNKIVNKFDPIGVGQIHVSKRNDGTYYVFDGQHRWTAFRILNKDTIDCIVYEGLTIEEEAKAYDFYNTIKTQNALDREKALVVAKDIHAIRRKLFVEDLGLEIDYDRTYHGDKIQAVGAIVEIYEKGQANDLQEVLTILRDSFGIDKKNFQAMIMQGVFDFIKEYRNKYETKWLVNRLSKFGIDQLISEQMIFRRAHNCSKREAIKYAIVKFYNHGKRKGKI